MPDDATARRLIQRATSQTEPIIRNHKFIVPVVKEFYPAQRNLLGLNISCGEGRSEEILLRLRSPSSPSTFLPYESILHTLLHELSHNIHRNHSPAFYKLLDQLVQEFEALQASATVGGSCRSGGSFEVPAAGRVGGRHAGQELSTFDRRLAAAKAAEERARRQQWMPSGPHRLGGIHSSSSLRALPPGMAAAMAAERRAEDNVWCPTERLYAGVPITTINGNGSGGNSGGEEIDAAINAILQHENNNTIHTNEKEEDKKKKCRQGSTNEKDACIIDLTDDTDIDTININPTTSTPWICTVCTAINTSPTFLCCAICSAPRIL